MTCKNKFELYAPHGYDYRAYEIKCGNTDHNGDRAVCDTCAADHNIMQDIRRHEANVQADNDWAHSAGWGDF
tara:strand:+ start:649 stop:864 length:216 start_codon:yes stop_codon:yes gene_type:complete